VVMRPRQHYPAFVEQLGVGVRSHGEVQANSSFFTGDSPTKLRALHRLKADRLSNDLPPVKLMYVC
jgi:hypothetical protein